MVILICFLVALLGLGIYGYSTNAKFSWIGQQMFWCGLLVTLLRFESSVFTLGNHLGK